MDPQTSKDEYTMDDILESAGVLNLEQAKQLTDEVKRMREEEWN
jgi:hypothetical protein